MTRILVLSDTHVTTIQALPEEIIQAISEAEWIVHCGDYTSITVVEELRGSARHFVGVYGNTDPRDICNQLPFQTIFELEGKKVAVVHPPWGGPPDGLEAELAARFPHVDAILFGHTHEPCNLRLNGTLLLNPGQSYSSFMTPASMATLTVNKQEVSGEVLIVG
ncbi:MAG: YfcE family phosphodiesterase [Chloroflexi bacterium]|nr:YfcE family phosphodiesterase [Chloroflexota bacterium]